MDVEGASKGRSIVSLSSATIASPTLGYPKARFAVDKLAFPPLRNHDFWHYRRRMTGVSEKGKWWPWR
jgi:hypothetical protein